MELNAKEKKIIEKSVNEIITISNISMIYRSKLSARDAIDRLTRMGFLCWNKQGGCGITDKGMYYYKNEIDKGQKVLI